MFCGGWWPKPHASLSMNQSARSQFHPAVPCRNGFLIRPIQWVNCDRGSLILSSKELHPFMELQCSTRVLTPSPHPSSPTPHACLHSLQSLHPATLASRARVVSPERVSRVCWRSRKSVWRLRGTAVAAPGDGDGTPPLHLVLGEG